MSSPIGFVFLLLTTSQLIIRPSAFNPSLVTIPFVQIFIIPCLLFSLSGVQRQLTGEALARNPVTVLLLGFTLCHFISSIVNLGPTSGFEEINIFVKSLVYYFLVIANVDTRRRIVLFGSAYSAFMLFSVLVAMANYYHLVDMPLYKQFGEYAGWDNLNDKIIYNYRLSGPTGTSTGDPNDFALMMLPGIFFAGYFVFKAPRLWQKLLALIVMLILLQGVRLTQSRGGMLGLLAGLATLVVVHRGVKRSLPLLIVGAVGVLTLSAGRQMDFSMESGSGQARIQVWLECLNLMKLNPLLGVGAGQLTNHARRMAHNSFLQAYAELGLPGGTMFFGAFFAAGWCLYRMRPHINSRVDPEMWRMRPMILAVLVSTIVSMNALTRTYAMETFVVVGLVSACYHCLSNGYRDTPIRSDSRLFGLMFLASVGFLVAIRFKVLTSM